MSYRSYKKRKFSNWGKPRAKKRLIYFFAHLGLTFTVALAVVAVGIGIYFLIKSVIYGNKVVITSNYSQLPSITTNYSQLPPNLLYSTFYFGFANSPWLDASATTMFEDNNEAALVFPPQYSWQEIDVSVYNQLQSITTNYNQLPITTKVIQEDGAYKVLLFAPDGSPILTATSTPIVSNYPGAVGVGGTPDDFLVVYGAYRGAAARIIKTGDGWNVQDVSQYFPYRVMHKGFDPAVIFDNKTYMSYKSYRTYYIYSLTDGNPKLIKLFSDSSGKIVGAVDLTPLLFPSGVTSAEFNIGSSNDQTGHSMTNILIAKIIDTGGAVRYYQFADDGFDTGRSFTAQSANVNNYPWPVYGVTLAPAFGGLNGVPVQFFVSNDGRNWQPAEPGSETVFNNQSGNRLLWKAIFNPSTDASISPFLGEMRLDFQVVRP